MGIMARRRQRFERTVIGAVEAPKAQEPAPENTPLEPVPQESQAEPEQDQEAPKQFNQRRRK